MRYPQTKDEFRAMAAEFKKDYYYVEPYAFALGRVTGGGPLNPTIEYLKVNIKESFDTAAFIIKILGHECRELKLSGAFSAMALNSQLTEILRYFKPFEGEPDHKNIEALKLMADEWHKPAMLNLPYVIFLRDEPIGDQFPVKDPAVCRFITHLRQQKQ